MRQYCTYQSRGQCNRDRLSPAEMFKRKRGTGKLLCLNLNGQILNLVFEILKLLLKVGSAHLPLSFTSEMAQRTGANFDSLGAELIECILEKLVTDNCGTAQLTQLAMLSRAFQEAVRRCTRTLVLQSHRKSRKNALPEDAYDPLFILSKELTLRPRVAKLVVTPRAPMAFVDTATNMEWESATVACRAQLRALQWGKLLSKSRFSLKRLDLESGGQLVLRRDLPNIVSSFENLEELALHGEFHDERDPGPQALETLQGCGMTKLDLSGLKPSVIGVWFVIPEVLAQLTALRSLRLQVPVSNWSGRWTAALAHGLKTLNLELLRGAVFVGFVDRIVHTITMQCPSLRRLIFYSHPADIVLGAFPNINQPAWDIKSFLKRCPNLEKLMISHSISHLVENFAQIVQKSGLVPGMGSHWRKRSSNENFVRDKLLVSQVRTREDLVKSDDLGTSLKEFGIFQVIVPISSRTSYNHPNEPNIRSRIIGEVGSVQSWFDAFRNAQL